MSNPLVDFCNDYSLKPADYGSGNYNRVRNLTFTVNAPLSTYFCLGDGLSHRLYALLFQAKELKTAQPLVSYDSNTTLGVNKKTNCFYSNYALIFKNATQLMFDKIQDSSRREATLIFGARPYDLNVADKRPSLLHVNFMLSGNTLHTTAVFGHCSLYPMFSYNILAVKLMAETLRKLLKTKESLEHFYITSMTNRAAVIPVAPKTVLTKLLPAPDVYELIQLEKSIRTEKRVTKPIPSIALQAESQMLFDDIFAYWEGKNATATRAA